MQEFDVSKALQLGYTIPKVYQEFQDYWQQDASRQTCLDAYQRGKQSFVPNLLPEQAVQLTAEETLGILADRLGNALDLAISPEYANPENIPGTLPEAIQSPVIHEPDGSWLKRTNMVGINVRTVQSFWNIVKYALTLPNAQDSIHILPIWEAGVVGSIYGLSSWELNPEFYSQELANICPQLNTIERQLRAVVNILHALGKSVGMDVIPHTDRFSQASLVFPQYFEWLQRQDTEIIDHRNTLHEEVQQKIFEFLQQHGSAVPSEDVPPTSAEFFSDQVSEEKRVRILFGLPKDYAGREERRNMLVRHLYSYGFEAVPGTMAPPFRGMKVDTREDAKIVDAQGMVWRDYLITKPEPMSRVFGPLARLKYYGRLNDNVDWEVDFDNPRTEVWEYLCEKYYQVHRRYGFDFMRGDMSHVQMRKEGVPADKIDRYYDILGAVKNYVREKGAPYFGYFAETFLPPRDIFGYGEELDHLEASDADSTLGDLQSTCVGSDVFLRRLRQYYDWLETRLCVPNFTVMTGDKDDPRFDEFYVKGNEARLFIAFFLDMPSYMGLGFECRDVHYAPVPNEHYTKLYVFLDKSGHNIHPGKATTGPYIWGKNGYLYRNITRLKLYADSMFAKVKDRKCRWLICPDPSAENNIVAWTQQEDPDYLFVVNTDTENPVLRFAIPMIPNADVKAVWRFDFSTADNVPEADRTLSFNGKHYKIIKMTPGEGRVYRLST